MNIFNKKTILFFSISSLMLNGCVAKNELGTKPLQKVTVASQLKQVQPTWAKVRVANIKKVSAKKDDCIDCYATPMDYSKPPSFTNNAFTKATYKPMKKAIKIPVRSTETKRYGNYAYNETASDTAVKRSNYANSKYVAPVVNPINSSYGKYSDTTSTIAIQVGAFSKIRGAEAYKKRYNVLSSKYKVAIKTGTKNNKPLHRVRIEGFKNKNQAKKFMDSYGISDGFLVRN